MGAGSGGNRGATNAPHTGRGCTHGPPAAAHTGRGCTHGPPAAAHTGRGCTHGPPGAAHTGRGCTHGPGLHTRAARGCTHGPPAAAHTGRGCTHGPGLHTRAAAAHTGRGCTHGPPAAAHTGRPRLHTRAGAAHTEGEPRCAAPHVKRSDKRLQATPAPTSPLQLTQGPQGGGDRSPVPSRARTSPTWDTLVREEAIVHQEVVTRVSPPPPSGSCRRPIGLGASPYHKRLS
jgi:hypothetical protein